MLDWFLKLSPEVQIAVVGLGTGILALLGAAVRGYIARNPDREAEFKAKPMEVTLCETDRQLVREMTDAIRDHATAVSHHREEIKVGNAFAGQRQRRG